MTNVKVVLVTVPSASVAEKLCEELVRQSLVACGNIISGVTSIFRWQGEVQRDEELLVVFKTVGESVPHLIERVSELHPYEVPEVLVLSVEDGAPAYLHWVSSEVKRTSEPET
jgi:periplasmic divalent cation tolerance protein